MRPGTSFTVFAAVVFVVSTASEGSASYPSTTSLSTHVSRQAGTNGLGLVLSPTWEAVWKIIDQAIHKQRLNLGSHAYRNQKAKTLVTGFGAPNTYLHSKIRAALDTFKNRNHWRSLRRMSAIDLLITKYGVDAVDWSKVETNDKIYYIAIQAAMQYLFYTDTCATFYNTKLQTWTTCWLGLRRTNDFAFCGSSVAMNLPVPCRSAVKKFDFGLCDGSGSAGPSVSTSANSEEWICPGAKGASQGSSPSYVPKSVQNMVESSWGSAFNGFMFGSRMSVRTLASQIMTRLIRRGSENEVGDEELDQSIASAKSMNQTMSSKFSVSSSREFTMEIYPVYKTAVDERCNVKNFPSTCYSACCDSAYRNSQFCRTGGSHCF